MRKIVRETTPYERETRLEDFLARHSQYAENRGGYEQSADNGIEARLKRSGEAFGRLLVLLNMKGVIDDISCCNIVGLDHFDMKTKEIITINDDD
jgi:hypothetical protein